jgi:hypothetical protein
MQFSSTFVLSLFLASTALASAIPRDDSVVVNGTVLEDGVPDFDPLELYGEEVGAHDERDLDALEARGTDGDKIVSCARSYEGTKYLYGGCKANKPFGPASGGMDCSCLSRTCVYKGTGTVIPRTTKTQYPTKAGKCHQIARSSAKPGDLLFWGCGTSAGIHHVGIYEKAGYVIHAPHTGTVVKSAKIWTSEICSHAVRCW